MAQDSGVIGTRPCHVNRGERWQQTGGEGRSLAWAIIIWQGFSHLNGTIANQIVTGVEIHRGMVQPPPHDGGGQAAPYLFFC
jgi:hypothetical protein